MLFIPFHFLGKVVLGLRKVFVDVVAVFSKEGELKPVSFTWEDGRRYRIDRILNKRRAASLKVGGHGICYDCRVMGKVVRLFLDDGKWFMEAKRQL